MKNRAASTRALLIMAAIFTASILSCTTEKNYYTTAPTTDTRPPVVTWIAPIGGSTVQGIIDLRLIADDESGIDSLRIFVDGSTRLGLSDIGHADSLYILPWDSRSDSDGVHTFEARAYDKAGNVGISPQLSLRVQNSPRPPSDDHLPPQIMWLSPTGGSEVSDTVTLILSAWDANGVDSVRFYKNGSTAPDFLIEGHADSLYTLLWNTLNDSDGVYVIEARAWDKAGNQGSVPAQVIRVHNNPTPPPEDRTPPSIEWLSPTGVVVIRGSVTLSFKATDNVSVSQVWIYKNGFTPENFRLQGTADSVYAVLWNTRNDSDGVNVLEIRAWDSAGNVGLGSSLVLHVENRPPDRIPPELNWISQSGGPTVRGLVNLRLQASDDRGVDSVWIYKNGLSPVEFHLPTQPNGIYEFNWNTELDSDGVYVLEARGWDAARNAGFAPSLAVRAQNHAQQGGDVIPPVVTWLSPEPGTIVRDSVDLQFTVTDASGIDSVKVYVDGIASVILAGNEDGEYQYSWNSWGEPNGRRVLEVRAWDRARNVGIGQPIGLTVDNHRILWVPDDYETIQGAINASQNGDTIRVRPGEYHEGPRFNGHLVWLESSDGPERTHINAVGWEQGIYAANGEDEHTIIRGFRITCDWIGVLCLENVAIKISNCIVDGESIGVNLHNSNSMLVNSIIIDSEVGIRPAYSWGKVFNCIVMGCQIGMHNFAVSRTGFSRGWNLFYNNEQDYRGFDPADGDVFENPQFMNESFRLSGNSPAIDAGNPEILDPDSTRSDIGIYGGPLSYPIQ